MLYTNPVGFQIEAIDPHIKVYFKTVSPKGKEGDISLPFASSMGRSIVLGRLSQRQFPPMAIWTPLVTRFETATNRSTNTIDPSGPLRGWI